jgi:hypothetical protein
MKARTIPKRQRTAGLFGEQRGVAEIVGFLIVTSALFGIVTYVLVVKGQQAGLKAQGLIDVMREAEARQREFISLVYAENDNGQIKVYLYNYGTENVGENARFFIQGREVFPLRTDGHIYKDADATTKTLYDSIPPSRLVEIIFLDNFGKEFYLTVLTEHRRVYCWWIS